MTDYLGVIDRGIGGLGFYNKIREISKCPLLYFADTGYAPYGMVEKRTLNRRLQQITRLMYLQGASKIVIACNFASAAFTDTEEVKGIITFGVSSVLKNKGHKTALIAGEGTVRSGVSRKQFAQHGLSVTQRITQPLSIHIEQGILNGQVLQDDLKRILQPLRNHDAISLACTHYPAIDHEIKKHVNASCTLIDPVDEMVEWVQENWPSRNTSAETVFMSTGNSEQFKSNSK